MNLKLNFKRLLPTLLPPLLLVACTGTAEPESTSRLGLINAGGSQLRTVTPSAPGTDAAQTVSGAADLEVLPGGSKVVVAFRDHIELRDAPSSAPPPSPPRPASRPAT